MNISSLKIATYSALITALMFWVLFQLGKIPAIQDVSPFAEDPYDAIASFAFQIAVVIALLSTARIVSIKDESDMRRRVPFILRGILLVELCVFVTLSANLVAVINAPPLARSAPMRYISGGMIFLALLFLSTGIVWLRARNEAGRLPAQATQDALAQTIGDCWILITALSVWTVGRIPLLRPVWNWLDSLARAIALLWNQRLSFANPSQHPWGFATAFAVLIGFLAAGFIMLNEGLFEGGPKNPAIALLLTGIFFAGETIAIFLSFLLFGGYLGLRPKL